MDEAVEEVHSLGGFERRSPMGLRPTHQEDHHQFTKGQPPQESPGQSHFFRRNQVNIPPPTASISASALG
jgi:hypothetical protein